MTTSRLSNKELCYARQRTEVLLDSLAKGELSDSFNDSKEEKPIRELKAPVRIRKACQGCSAICCRRPLTVRLMQSEAAQVEAGTYPLKTKRLTFGGWRGYGYTIPTKPSGWCIYFDQKTKGCSVYDKRPEACKRWYCGKNGKNHAGWLYLKEQTEAYIMRKRREAKPRKKKKGSKK